MKHFKKPCLVGLALLLLFVGSFGFNVWRENPASPVTAGSANQTPTTLTVTGTITCLQPASGTDPQNMSCASGIKADNGTFYALNETSNLKAGVILMGKRVKVEGTLTKPATTYKSAGTITVQSVLPPEVKAR